MNKDQKKELASRVMDAIEYVMPSGEVFTAMLAVDTIGEPSFDGDPLAIDIYDTDGDETVLSVSLAQLVQEMIDDRCSDDRYDEPVTPLELLRDGLRELFQLVDEHLKDRQVRVGVLQELERGMPKV